MVDGKLKLGEMGTNLKKPCVECPFRKDSLAGWLGDWKSVREIHDFVMFEGHLPCHMTTIENTKSTDDMQHCVGSIQYMNTNAKRCIDKRLAKIQLHYKNLDASNILSVTEFFERHGKPLKAMAQEAGLVGPDEPKSEFQTHLENVVKSNDHE